MAIKGLTDRAAAFPAIGILRKGEKKTSENAPGKDLTYFRFVTDDQLAEEMFIKAYPDAESLRNINVYLPHKTTDENMDAWIEKWVAGGLIYRSDGHDLVLWRTDKGAYSTEVKPDPKPEIKEDGKRADGSSQVGRLSVIVPELGRFATVTVLTTSKWDILNLTRQLRSYEALEGDLRGIPFVLKRRLCKISTPAGNGKRARREKWLLSIETLPRYTIAKIAAMERAALPDGVEVIDSNDYTVHEVPANIVNPFEDEPEVPTDKPAPTPTDEEKKTNGNGKPYKFPSGAAKDFWDLVQQNTGNFYDHPEHLKQTIGGWFNFASQDLWDAKLSEAVDHARHKREAEKGPTIEGQVTQEEIQF